MHAWRGQRGECREYREEKGGRRTEDAGRRTEDAGRTRWGGAWRGKRGDKGEYRENGEETEGFLERDRVGSGPRDICDI